MSASRLINRNVMAGSGRTSMRLEPELWEALADICELEKLSLAEIIKKIEAEKHPGGRTSAVRVFVVQYFRTVYKQMHPAKEHAKSHAKEHE